MREGGRPDERKESPGQPPRSAYYCTMWSKGSRRGGLLPPGWRKIRQAVIRRDGGRCVFCGAPGNHVDHIDPGGPHDLWNLRLLCQLHHMQRTAEQSHAARRAHGWTKPKREHRPKGKHPGIL